MQYIEGADLGWILEDYAADNELIPHEEVLRIITEICQALDYAHSQGIIHRDVKPSNIILNKQGQAFLTDFGLALLQAEGTRGEIFGSPYYIAPEQAINSAGAVPQSDIYALGVVLYRMLTGSVPFDEGSMMDIAMAHMTDTPPSPLFLNPQLHPALVPVLEIAMRKEPSARYQSGAALAGALAKAMQISAQPSRATKPGTTRLSMLSVPDKVSEFRKDNPLPPLPAEASTTQPQVTRRPPPVPVDTPNTSPPSVSADSLNATQRPTPRRRTGLLAGIGIGVIACLALLLLLLALANRSGESVAALTTDTAVVMADVATATPLPTVTILPSVTPIVASPTALVLVPITEVSVQVIAPTVTPSPQAINYVLRLRRRGEDSLFIINLTADYGLALAPLQLGDGRGAIIGTEWGLAMLDTGACVTAWKDGGHPRAPDVTCARVGEHLTRRGGERFWKDDYGVYYDGVLVDTCAADDCLVRIPG
jgi:hypothetical protein